MKINKERNAVSNTLMFIFGTIVLVAMVVVGNVYSKNGVFEINSSIEKLSSFIALSILLVIVLGVYQSIVSTVLLNRVEASARRSENLVEALSDTVNIFFKTYLRKEKSVQESIKEIKETLDKVGIEDDRLC